MKEKGFTLVELIAVLVILALIVIVAFPNILKAISNTNSNMSEATKELLRSNARTYFNDNPTKTCVDVATLVKENYTKSPISTVKSEDSKKIEDNWSIKATNNGSKWVYTIYESKC